MPLTIQEIVAKARADASYDPAEDGSELLESVTKPLADKNRELLDKNKKLSDVTKTLPEGFDIAEYNRLVQLEKDGKLAEHKGDEKLQALRQQLTEAHEQALEQERKTAAGLRSALEIEMLDNAAQKAITGANGNPDLLLPHVRSQLKMVQKDDGSYAAVVVDNKGEQRFSVQSAGDYMGISELVGELKANDLYKPAFYADNKGGGSGNGSGRGTGDNPWVKGAGFNRTEQAKMLNANPALAQTLQKEAEAANQAQTPQ